MSFANPILLAAAFVDNMIEGIGDVIRTEERAFANVGKAGLDFWFVSSSLLKIRC
jgi:beta-D-xylosidase 4